MLALLIVLPIRYFIFQPFIVKGISMEPNFKDGNYLIVDEITYRFREPQRGEVIVFHYPFNPSEKFIKRIIGLPGEEIELKDGQITVTMKNGEKKILEEDYLSSPFDLPEEKIVLGNNEYFVLGDNRLHSFDSKNWGKLPRNFIIGRVIWRLYPFDEISAITPPAY